MSDQQFRNLMQKQSPTRQDIKQFAELLPEQDRQFLEYLVRNGPTDEQDLIASLGFLSDVEQAREYVKYYQPLLTMRGKSTNGGQQISIDPSRADLLEFLFE
jgi:hypothetical protein